MDPRAGLILELLLAGLAGPAPTLTHLLMGFEVTQGPEGERQDILYGLHTCWLGASCPGVALSDPAST